MRRVIHAAKILPDHYLLLDEDLEWVFEDGTSTGVWGQSVYDALQKARQEWRLKAFRPLNCGYRFMITPRDEHGRKALFWEMAESFQSANGVYYDELEGCRFRVDNPSREALSLLKRI